MSYYDSEDEYYYDNYSYDDEIDNIDFISDEFSEKMMTDVLLSSGLISERNTRYIGTMERLVFLYGDSSEVYSPAEIRFIEHMQSVIVYPDFVKTIYHGKVSCRTIVTKINNSGHDALLDCVSFEKIIDKALDGFNIFFFVTNDCLFIGCRVYDKDGKKDCALSNPIKLRHELEQLIDDLSYLSGIDSFKEYYNSCLMIIKDGQTDDYDYEHTVIRRKGIQFSYLDDMNSLERDMGLDTSREKERYWRMFNDEPEESFATILDEAEESLSFIKSTRINTYEMLFEADELMRQADEAEAQNKRLMAQIASEPNTNKKNDTEAMALLDDPEEMIKLLKKRRGV